jgi:UDP-3-O-[3-hydroxymyristoyl] glucosamine N-acyltransferase
VIGAGAFVGDNCEIGDGCILRPNTTLYHGTRLGRRVIVHSGAVLGADGFGYMRIGDDCYKIPQIGIVVIEDDVEIGAHSAVDRAKTGTTVIGARTKIDNLVHVAHNCKIGSDCILVAQVGIAGSAHVGRGVVFAGQAGMGDHATVGDGAMVLGRGGVIGNVPAGATVSGFPARNHRDKLRQEAEVARLPGTSKRIRMLEKANADLAARNERLERLVARLTEQLGLSPEP